MNKKYRWVALLALISCFHVIGCRRPMSQRQNKMFDVPSRPFFGTHSLDNIDNFLSQHLDNGEIQTVRLRFSSGAEMQRILVRMNVKQGAITFMSKNGSMVFLPSNRVACVVGRELDKEAFTYEVANASQSLAILCGESTDACGVNALRAVQHVNVQGVSGGLTTQDLPVMIDGKYWVVEIHLKKSKDYDGCAMRWIVPNLK